MRPSKETKRNKGFKTAFRAGIVIVLILSLLISWIAVSVIRAVDRRVNPPQKTEQGGNWVEVKDTVIVEKVKQVFVRDTIYIRPTPAPKSKQEDPVAPKKDTASR